MATGRGHGETKMAAASHQSKQGRKPRRLSSVKRIYDCCSCAESVAPTGHGHVLARCAQPEIGPIQEAAAPTWLLSSKLRGSFPWKSNFHLTDVWGPKKPNSSSPLTDVGNVHVFTLSSTELLIGYLLKDVGLCEATINFL